MLSILASRSNIGAFCATVFLLAPAAAHAQTQFKITFAPQTQVLTPGTSVTYSASIFNDTNAALYINDDAVGSLPAGLTSDDTLFFNTFGGTPILLGSKQTYPMTSLFTITDVSAAPGAYLLNPYTIFGGAAPDSVDQYGNTTFDVTVSNAAAVPEASTTISFGLLLALGLGGTVIAAKKRKTAQSVS